jgi:hypothetical protein
VFRTTGNREPPLNKQADERPRDEARWTFFTNHAHVLFVLATTPNARLRDIAERVGVTERAAQRIVRELHDAGYLEVEKIGRRNTYRIDPDHALRHPVEAHCTISELLELIARSGSAV